MSDVALVTVRKLGVGENINQKYNSYEEMIKDVKAKLTIVEGNILKARWLVGWQAFILMDDRKYGDHSIEEYATSRLKRQKINYLIYPVGNDRMNLFFGREECLAAVRLMMGRPLSLLSPEEDFILGAMLGYDIRVQCERYCERKCRSCRQAQ